MTDSQLLTRFADHGDQNAFAELVRRNVDLVYGAATRRAEGDRHRAEDIAQQVFIDLARKARVLAGHPCLAGWLYASVRFTAVNTLRSEQRRVAREQEAEVMKISENLSEPHWAQIRPVIDEALEELNEEARQSVLMRFFGQQSFQMIGQHLGLSENAAQKRVDRALDQLNAVLTRRGLGSTAAVLSAALAQAGVTAPVGLANSMTAASVIGVTATAAGKLSILGLVKILVGVGVAVVVGASTGTWRGENAIKQAANEQLEDSLRKIGALEMRLRNETKRALNAEAETALLLSEIEKMREARIAASKAAVSTPLPASPSGINNNAESAEYTVLPGDTIWVIAKQHQLTVAQLLALNSDVKLGLLKVGQVIKLK